jgi:hypothetical protein
VITPIYEIGVGIGIQRLRKFLTVNHILMDTDYPHFDSGYTARCPASRAKRFDAQAECKCSSCGVLIGEAGGSDPAVERYTKGLPDALLNLIISAHEIVVCHKGPALTSVQFYPEVLNVLDSSFGCDSFRT